ncbi:MAG: ABC transporter permease [Microscillaceae bacterium]|jgi:putative ABC transport system permease protein|nr:ABC transporter permease [Microscillaceae bacterium]
MLKNYLKIAWRSIWRNKVFSFINIVGLSTGMACAFLLYLYIQHELSYDKFHQRAQDIYTVQTTYTSDNQTTQFVYTMGGVAAALKKDYPDVAEATRIRGWGAQLSFGDKKISRDDMYYVDNSFFKILPYRFLAGSAENALKNPKSIVLTKSLAESLFGDVASAMQKNVGMDNETLLVSGVIEDMPNNTSFSFSAAMPIQAIPAANLADMGAEGWVGVGCQTLVRLQPNADYKALNQKIPQLQKYYREASEKVGFKATMSLVPLNYMRLYDFGEGSGNTIMYVYILGVLAILILLIASANYMNLATARSVTRAKEVGIRKVVGSYRWQLMGQFLAEAMVFTFLALVLSLFMVELALPYFNELANKKLTLTAVLENNTFVGMLLIFIILSLLSGFYPALILSAFNPVKVLKGKFFGNAQGIWLRKSLVVFQFTISIVMICCTWLIFSQLQYIRQKDLGFNREQLLVIPLNDDFNRAKANGLRQQLVDNQLVKQAALTNVVPAYNSWSRNPYKYISEEGNSRQLDMDDMPIGYDYLATMEMKLVAGRNFSRQIQTDSTQSCIVNETFVKTAGFKNPLGKTIESVLAKGRKLKIIGVVKDFHLHSLHASVNPTLLFIAHRPFNLIARVAPQNIEQTMKAMAKTWQSFTQKYPFNPMFLDVAFANRYENDRKQAQVFLSFSVLAVLIACLGIFGLATFATQQKRKEIGIRKVLGANLNDIIFLLSKDFMRLVLISIGLALPIAYYFAGQWLQYFVYKIDLWAHWYIFVLGGALALAINFAITGTQALRAIAINPADVLKDE